MTSTALPIGTWKALRQARVSGQNMRAWAACCAHVPSGIMCSYQRLSCTYFREDLGLRPTLLGQVHKALRQQYGEPFREVRYQLATWLPCSITQ